MNRLYKLAFIFVIGLFSTTLIAAPGDVLRDPTRPAFHTDIPISSTKNKELEIDAIFSGPNNKTVIIGGHNFTVGDEVLGSTITQIYPDGIRLRNNDEEFEILMPYSTVKSLTTNVKKKHEEME